MAVVLVGGGARSGKSSFAERWVQARHPSAVFVATGQALDDEMKERIAHHRVNRGAMWETIEAPLDLTAILRDEATVFQAIVVDCLTLWLSNVLLAEDRDPESEIQSFVELLRTWDGPDLVLVTNEVGCGIVPDNALARAFRDLAGRLNQLAAEASDEVYWTVFGQPLRIKPPGGVK